MIERDGRRADADHRHQAGVPGAGRLAGDDLPPPPPARSPRRRGRGRRPPGRCPSAEREAVLEVLHCERFVDSSPAQVYATLLDEGRYLCSERTMYRLLDAKHGGVRERRDQLTHPAYAKPELLAERPNELWSWDITKLKGPAKWTYFYLYVILDVFSRYVVGWTVQHRETGPLAKALIAQADRAAADRARPADGARRPRRADALQAGRVPARRPRRHQDATAGPTPRPTTPTPRRTSRRSSTGPSSPTASTTIEHARAFCRGFFDWYNHEHRHSGIGLMTPAAVHHGQAEPSSTPPAPASSTPPTRATPSGSSAEPPVAARAAHRRLDQQARHEGGRSLNSDRQASHRT